MQRFGIIGGGAWGTALAQVLRRAGRDVVLWAHEQETVAAINRDHVNTPFLPGIALDPAIVATTDLAALRTDVLLLAPPAQHLRAICSALAPASRSTPIVICTKGIEEASGALMSEVAGAILQHASLAVLSGPTFAAEVARGLPTAVTLACGGGQEQWQRLCALIARPHFRPYFSEEVIDAEGFFDTGDLA